MSDAEATAVANTWGYDLKGVYNADKILVFLRQDAPPLDVIGGPALEVVRGVPEAREEAQRIKGQTGHDVLDPAWYGPVEAAAGENVRQRNKCIQGALGVGIPNAILTAWTLAESGTSLLMLIPYLLCLVGWVAVANWLRKFVLLTKSYGAEIKPKVDLLRQVLNVAEEKLLGALD